MSKEKPTDDPRQRTDWDRTSRLTSPGKGIRRRSSGRELQNPIWKSGMRPTPISRRGAMHGDIADA